MKKSTVDALSQFIQAVVREVESVGGLDNDPLRNLAECALDRLREEIEYEPGTTRLRPATYDQLRRGLEVLKESPNQPSEPKGITMNPNHCPFCGHDKVNALPDPQDPEGDALGMYQVICYTCGAMGPTRKGAESAIEAWNRIARKSKSSEML